MLTIRTFLARAAVRLAIFAAPVNDRPALEVAFKALGRGGPGAPA